MSTAVSVRENAFTFRVGMEAQINVSELPAYAGPYTVTPGAQAQTLSTQGRRMTSDVTVAAIPSCYGLITWNGAYLTVS